MDGMKERGVEDGGRRRVKMKKKGWRRYEEKKRKN